MSIHSEIDQTLRQLGSVVPPSGMELRIQRGLQQTPRSFSRSVIYAISGGALAAGVAVSAVALNPTLQRLIFPHHAMIQTPQAQNLGSTPRPATGGFHAAGVVHVPLEPVPVQPTPDNQGRGRSRSGRATLPNGSLAPLPRGVAPSQPDARAGSTSQ